MLPSVLEREIEAVLNHFPDSSVSRKEIQDLSATIAKTYLKRIRNGDTLFSRDVALGAVFLACWKLGQHFSASELAQVAKVDLTAWPSVAKAMQQQLQDIL